MNPQLLTAEELGVRLEIAGNLAIWEASPLYKHQKEVDRIRDSIIKIVTGNNPCDCVDAADVYVQFPAIYLANGVKDVIVFNPYTQEIVHFRKDKTQNFTSPTEIELECGCRCTV